VSPRVLSVARTRHSRTERGATLVETAFVLTLVLLPLLLGIMGFGHALYAYHFVSHASKTAARWAVVNGATCNNDLSCSYTTGASTTDIQTYATNLLPAGLDPADVVATASFPLQTGGPEICFKTVGTVASASNYPGCTVQVTVGYAYRFIFPFVPVNSTTTSPCTTPGWCLSSTSEMVIVH
jgi:Flp pilus assembly protein TadG